MTSPRLNLNEALAPMMLHGQEWGYIENPSQETLDALRPIDGAGLELPCQDSACGQSLVQEVRPQWRNNRRPEDLPSRLWVLYHS